MSTIEMATTDEVAPPTDEDLTDEELTALALAADPEAVVDDDAVAWSPAGSGVALLPDWYMPAPMTARRDLKSRVIAWSVVASIVAINAGGLCVTYGRVVLG